MAFDPAQALGAFLSDQRANPAPPRSGVAAADPRMLTQRLSAEQQAVVDHVLAGDDVIVDATCGSGKTFTIQHLCGEASATMKVLYLTYSKLLKADAQARVRGAKVQNYHGIVYPSLLRAGIRCGIGESIAQFNANFKHLSKDFPRYDLMVIDEYQDITEEYAELLLNIKSLNPLMQIVMVGDLEQKVRADTTLDAQAFAKKLCVDPIMLPFTQSFRVGPEIAGKLSTGWNKPVVGANEHQVVEEMSFTEAVALLSELEPADVLCLGRRNGPMSQALNIIERDFSQRFNKDTVYASIRQGDQVVDYDDAAIFTTFDASKGLERDTCIIFDFDESMWDMRNSYPDANPEVLRNVFLVAASRGKNRVVFVRSSDLEAELMEDEFVDEYADEVADTDQALDGADEADETTEPDPLDAVLGFIPVRRFVYLPKMEQPEYERPISVTECFDFKYAENVTDAYNLLDVVQINAPEASIEIDRTDGLIDLSPAVGHYQEMAFFEHYNPAKELENNTQSAYIDVLMGKLSTDAWRNALVLTAAATDQLRYVDQVDRTIAPEVTDAVVKRLGRHLPRDARNQVGVTMVGQVKASRTEVTDVTFVGVIDAIHEEKVYELKFVSELTHAMFLQVGMYVTMSGLKEGVLWNTRTNEQWVVRVPDHARFRNAVTVCMTKQSYKVFDGVALPITVDS